MIACLDVHYRNSHARAACVLLADWSDRAPISSHLAEVSDVASYQPGSFYLRELPCLLAVLRSLTTPPTALVVDGHVWISPDGKPGLGAHLHEAIDRAGPVLGVAKTQFMTLVDSPLMVPVQRGTSTRPLFVTSVGMQVVEAARLVRSMCGAHRIPEALRLADRLARTGIAVS